MKVTTLVLILLNLLILGCKPKDKSPLIIRDFIFTIEFYPSFNEPCRIILQKTGDKETLSIDNFYGNKRMRSKDKIGLIPEKCDNLLVEKCNLEYFGDSLFLKHVEKVSVNRVIFQQFGDSLLIVDLPKQKSLIKEGILDGITVFFRFKSDTTDNRFYFRCPHESDITEFKIIKSIFKIMDSSFKTEDAKSYIGRLKRYFGLKKE